MAGFPTPNGFGQQRAHVNSGYITINGRRVPVGNGIHGRDLANAAGPGRRPVKIGGGRTQLIDHTQFYSPSDLMDRHGKPVKISSIPDRTKGAELFSGHRNDYSRVLITEQVMDVAANFVRNSRNIEFDEDNADWVVFPQFKLPRGWGEPFAPLMIVFPREYPSTPPIGFYLPRYLQSPNGHFFDRVYHGAEQAPTVANWNWYCCYVNDGAWRPYPARHSGEWKLGDNLWTYITLINEVLGSPLNAS